MMKNKIIYLIALVLLCACEHNFPTWEEYNTKWLEDNKKNLGKNPEVDSVFILPSGVQCEVFHKGFGAIPKPSIDPVTERSSIIEVKYVGTLADGVVFDQSDSVSNSTLYLGNCIPGWRETLSLMPQGSHIKIYVPASAGYSTYGNKNAYGNFNVPPHSTLIFDIELIDVINF